MSQVRNKSSGQRARRGSVMIETALIFIIFASLLLGIMDFGQFLFIHQALVERARYAARWGAVTNPSDSAAITNMVLYNQPSSPPPGTRAYFNLSPSNVAVTTPDSGTDNYRLNIRISGYTYSILSLFIAGTYTGFRSPSRFPWACTTKTHFAGRSAGLLNRTSPPNGLPPLRDHALEASHRCVLDLCPC